MSRQYYYLVAGLPDIVYDDKKIPLSQLEFREYLKEHLPEDDMELIKLYYWRYDNQNVMNRLNGSDEEFLSLGNLTADDLDELFAAVKEGSFDTASKIAPPYFGEFIDAFKNETQLFEGKRWDLQLSELYYQFATSTSNTFINNWFLFEKDFNNVLTAYNCRNNEFDVAKQVIGEGELYDKLIKSSTKDFGITDEIENVERIFKAADEEDIIKQEKGLDIIKWEKLAEDSFFHYFSLEKLFAFTIQLSIAERWITLDKETGIKLFEELLNSLEGSYEFPADFSLK